MQVDLAECRLALTIFAISRHFFSFFTSFSQYCTKIVYKISIKKSIAPTKIAPTFSIVQINNELLQIVGLLRVKSKIP